jgi:hypothetical protein
VPNSTYSHASARTMTIAGAMNAVPATIKPFQPARSRPMWTASSVEFGPGMTLVAPTRSRKCSSLSHRRRSTTSCLIKAMCAAGPPNPIVPSFRNKRASSARRDPWTPCGSGTSPVCEVIGLGARQVWVSGRHRDPLLQCRRATATSPLPGAEVGERCLYSTGITARRNCARRLRSLRPKLPPYMRVAPRRLLDRNLSHGPPTASQARGAQAQERRPLAPRLVRNPYLQCL